VDDNGIMRDGLCALLRGHEEFEVAGVGSTSAEALQSARVGEPHIMVVGLSQTCQTGPDVISSVKARVGNIGVLVLTGQPEDILTDAALRAGVDGYLLKTDGCDVLFSALRQIAAGKGFVNPSIPDHVTGGAIRTHAPERGHGHRSTPGQLTDRERQVIRLIAGGKRTREIAELLSLSHKTIEKHRTSLMRKLGVRNASAVAAYAIAAGLADP